MPNIFTLSPSPLPFLCLLSFLPTSPVSPFPSSEFPLPLFCPSLISSAPSSLSPSSLLCVSLPPLSLLLLLPLCHLLPQGEIWVGADNQEEATEWSQVLRDAGKV